MKLGAGAGAVAGQADEGRGRGRGRHERLTHVLLNNNLFNGTLPTLGHKPALHSLDLSRNALRGTIPSLRLPALEFADFSHNALSGALPELGARVVFFSVSYNALSGRLMLPRGTSWRDATALVGLHAEHNGFDSVDDDLCNAPAALFASIQKGHSGGGCHLSSNPLVPAHDQESVALLEAVPTDNPGAVAPTVLAGAPDACRALPRCLHNCTVGPRCKFADAFTSARVVD